MGISALMFLVGAGFWPACRRYNHSTDWPTTAGVVSAAGLKLHISKPHIEPTYTPTICYSYSVDGIPRTGTRLDFADRVLAFHKEDGIAWIKQHYPVGKSVTVHYDPKDPDTAVLVPGAEDLVFIWNWWMTTTGLCFIGSWVLHRSVKQDPTDLQLEPRREGRATQNDHRVDEL